MLLLNAKNQGSSQAAEEKCFQHRRKEKNKYISIANTNKSEEEMMMTLVLLG